MNISYLKNKNIHFVECENWHDAYGYEKSEMKEDTINYIDKLQQENRQLQKELEEYKNPIKYFKYANKNVVEENKKLKDNWNKLKEFIAKEYYMYLPLEPSTMVCRKYGNKYIGVYNEEIKSIVTHEQMEQMAYKVDE